MPRHSALSKLPLLAAALGSAIGCDAPGSAVPPSSPGAALQGQSSCTSDRAKDETAPAPTTAPTASPCGGDATSIDWSAAALLAQASDGNARSIRALDAGDYLYLCVQGAGLKFPRAGAGAAADPRASNNFQVLIDADGDPATGYTQSFQAPSDREGPANGPNLMVENRTLHWIENDAVNRGTASGWAHSEAADIIRYEDDVLSLRISKQRLGATTTDLALGFKLMDPSWSTVEVLPRKGAFARLHAAPSEGLKGIVVPLYSLPLGISNRTLSAPSSCQQSLPATVPSTVDFVPDARSIADSDWGRLARAACQLRRADKELWTVVSGPGSRPFQEDDVATVAKLSWQPIRERGGKIFGYVHTLVRRGCLTAFRPLSEVVADVRRWREIDPAIEGIWIDEFYPRYEYADDSAGSGSGVPLTFPNGLDAAPDQLRQLGSPEINAVRQIDPSGGYYDQLRAQIRGVSPDLLTIGNAGGSLPSNQLKYDAAFDTVCTFEETYQTASERDWAGLERPPLRPHSSMLALVHTLKEDCTAVGCSRLSETMRRAKEHGYRYFFASDEPALWQRVPASLDAQIRIVTERDELDPTCGDQP